MSLPVHEIGVRPAKQGFRLNRRDARLMGVSAGIAIGAGTDVAIQTANVVLMQSDPLDIVDAALLNDLQAAAKRRFERGRG